MLKLDRKDKCPGRIYLCICLRNVLFSEYKVYEVAQQVCRPFWVNFSGTMIRKTTYPNWERICSEAVYFLHLFRQRRKVGVLSIYCQEDVLHEKLRCMGRGWCCEGRWRPRARGLRFRVTFLQGGWIHINATKMRFEPWTHLTPFNKVEMHGKVGKGWCCCGTEVEVPLSARLWRVGFFYFG